MRITLSFTFLLFCFNLSQAQTTPLDNTQVKKVIDGIQTKVPAPTPTPQPTYYPPVPPMPTPTPAPFAAPAPAPAAGTAAATPVANTGQPPIDQTAVINAETATSGKYEEYQSICRTHEYDKIRYQPTDVRAAKIAELKQGDSPQEQLALLKEYWSQADLKNFKTLATTLKNRKLNSLENDILNALIEMSNRNFRGATKILVKTVSGEEKNEEALKLLAEAYAYDNNYYEASTIYEDLNKAHKGAYLVEQCESLISNSLNADGEKICLEAAGRYPDNPFPYVYAGISHRERENFPTAVSFFRRSLKIRPTEMAATCLAEIYFIQKKFSEAAEYFNQSLSANPQSIRAVLGLAWAQLKAKDYPASLSAFKKACAMNTRYQSEIRKAYKALNDDKIIDAKKYLQLAESCGT